MEDWGVSPVWRLPLNSVEIKLFLITSASTPTKLCHLLYYLCTRKTGWQKEVQWAVNCDKAWGTSSFSFLPLLASGSRRGMGRTFHFDITSSILLPSIILRELVVV